MIGILKTPVHLFRFAQWIRRKTGLVFLSRLIDYFIRWWFSCWLPHTAKIGDRFEIGYGGLGCVIHVDAEIGEDCHLGTHVTIGGNATEKGTPKLGNHVYVGTGAKILGPITIGDHVVVAANAVVVKDVPRGSVVGGVPAKIVKSGINIEEFLYHLKTKQ